jgi:hypothetical protein
MSEPEKRTLEQHLEDALEELYDKKDGEDLTEFSSLRARLAAIDARKLSVLRIVGECVPRNKHVGCAECAYYAPHKVCPNWAGIAISDDLRQFKTVKCKYNEDGKPRDGYWHWIQKAVSE